MPKSQDPIKHSARFPFPIGYPDIMTKMQSVLPILYEHRIRGIVLPSLPH